jgi:hypothetical protein
MNTTSQNTNPWVTAAQTAVPTAPTPAPEAVVEPVSVELASLSPLFLSAHGGAGATVWASVFDGHDGGSVMGWVPADSPRGGAVLVLRGTVDGIAAAKKAIAHHGAGAFTCALAVAAAPGRAPRVISDELKILGGAVALVRAPWVPALLVRRAAQATPADIPTKDFTKITADLTTAGVILEGETK